VRRRLGALAALVLLTLPLGCGSAPAIPGNLHGPPAPILMIRDYVLRALVAQDQKLAGTFAGRTTYIIGTSDRRAVPHGLAGTAEPTASYTSYAAFASALASRRLPASDHAALYDIEKWPATPLAEQQNPRAYMVRFSALARAHGLFPILAPARDLLLVHGAACAKRANEGLNQAYIRCDLAGADAGAGALVVQSQVLESSPGLFRSFLSRAASQARAGNPRVSVLAQLATAPLDNTVPLADLVNAARSVQGIVQGFSLNARMVDLTAADGLLRSFRQQPGVPG
jgi:hypothetical protein